MGAACCAPMYSFCIRRQTFIKMAAQDTLLHELQSPRPQVTIACSLKPTRRKYASTSDEPFLPLVVGYTVFREAAKSPSSKFPIDPEGGIAIEYAIWWDWDIQHLYELEHVWVYLDADENLLKVEASAHGAKSPFSLTTTRYREKMTASRSMPNRANTLLRRMKSHSPPISRNT